jgi:DNA-binding transcriptional ArsR family regulator
LTRKLYLTYYSPMLHSPQQVPEAFGAISSAVRRQILDLLAEGERPVNGIASHFEMSRPAISQHLRILLAAGLVAEARYGRENRYQLVPERLAPVRDWISHYERFWDDRFKRLQSHLAKRSQR